MPWPVRSSCLSDLVDKARSIWGFHGKLKQRTSPSGPMALSGDFSDADGQFGDGLGLAMANDQSNSRTARTRTVLFI